MLPHLFAYLDLASGSMIIQAAIAGVVTVPILLRGRIRRLLGRGVPMDEMAEQTVTVAATVDMRPASPNDRPEASRP